MRIAPGARVAHAQYGAGTISATDDQYTVIEFDEHGSRRFVSRMVTLEPTTIPAPARVAAARKPRKKKEPAVPGAEPAAKAPKAAKTAK
jgi:hypothetical protein